MRETLALLLNRLEVNFRREDRNSHPLRSLDSYTAPQRHSRLYPGYPESQREKRDPKGARKPLIQYYWYRCIASDQNCVNPIGLNPAVVASQMVRPGNAIHTLPLRFRCDL